MNENKMYESGGMSLREKLKKKVIQTNQNKWVYPHEQNTDLALLTYVPFLCNVKMKTGSMEYHNSARI